MGMAGKELLVIPFPGTRKIEAGDKPMQTAKTLIGYDRVLCGIHFINLSYKSVFVIYVTESSPLPCSSIFTNPK
jgi:hypothetical protein